MALVLKQRLQLSITVYLFIFHQVVDPSPTAPLISTLRANGNQRSTSAGGNSNTNLAVNTGNCCGGEVSDWAIAAVIVFNRTISSSEIRSIEVWLANLYGNSGWRDL